MGGSTARIILAGAWLLVTAGTAAAVPCGAPLSRADTPTTADAMHILRRSATEIACPRSECDINGNGIVTVVDALIALKAAVGLPFAPACPAVVRPNFVVILTDDQRADTLWAMQNVQELLVEPGAEFQQAYSSTSECCSFRASFLSGGYERVNTGVKTGDNFNGAMVHFRDVETLATRLQAAGYATGFTGKYMHGYYPGYVPPGWTSFIANENGGQLMDWFNLYKITYGSSTTQPTAGTIVPVTQVYITSFQRDVAVEFIQEHADEPFFLLVATYAPHWPAITEPIDSLEFNDFNPVSPAFREADLTDKPGWVQEIAAAITARPCTGFVRPQLRTAKSIDRLVADVVAATQEAGIEDRTYFLYVSDNGIMWGEHRLPCDKGMAYEQAVRVPLVIKGPDADIVPVKPDPLVAAELDVPATILDLAGVSSDGDGFSLAGFLRGGPTPWRTAIHLENYGYLESNVLKGSVWQGLRVEDETGSWKYVEYGTGERELYNLLADPLEMENLAENLEYKDVRQTLRDQLAPHKGLTILTRSLEAAAVGVEYRVRLDSWGGISPTWTVSAGMLPAGISLGPHSGVISGTPQQAGSFNFTITAESAYIGTHSLKPDYFSRRYTLVVQ